MKSVVIFFLLFLLVHPEVTAGEEKEGFFDNRSIKNGSGQSQHDTCGIYSEFVVLRDNLVNRNIDRLERFFDFPIKDQQLLTFISSQDEIGNQQIIELDVDGFRSNFARMFPDAFLALLQKTTPEVANSDGYGEVDWQNLYDNQNLIFERSKLLYKAGDKAVIFRFVTENIEETGKYEMTVEYVFRFKNCKLKFEKCLIAG